MPTPIPPTRVAFVEAPSRFTSEVSLDRRRAAASSHALGTKAVFEPGARTAWHINPLGQTIIIKAGRGRMQIWGEPARELHDGDVIAIAPSVKHWYGADPRHAITLFTVQGAHDGETAEWFEEVTADQYEADKASALS